MAVLAVVYLDDVLESRSIVAALQQQLAVDGVNIFLVTHDHTGARTQEAGNIFPISSRRYLQSTGVYPNLSNLGLLAHGLGIPYLTRHFMHLLTHLTKPLLS